MSLFTFKFFIFLLIGIVGYYICPKKVQWLWLLALSYLFYISGGIGALGYMLTTTISVWGGSILLDRTEDLGRKKLSENKDIFSKEEKRAFKKQIKRRKQGIFWLTLLFNMGILIFLKYTDFMRENAGQLILPLGISFYTFQATGYLIDVYRGKCRPEKNLLKFALFVSFFPQILQGPIARFQELGPQLYQERKFNLSAVERGLVLMLWGYFKKLLIADRIGMLVNEVFNHHADYSGCIIAVAVLGFSIQQYADFSGGIDVVRGIGETLGIELPENFRRPYFSKSLAEFWRRWHITLGAWMRDYVFYPLATANGMGKISKITKKYLGDSVGRAAPVCLANIVVFLLVGIWHGANWHYLAWGLYNGLIIAVSALLEPLYARGRAFFRIKPESFGWKLFQMARTFLIVNIGGYFDRGNTFSDGLAMMSATIRNFGISHLQPKTLLSLGGMNGYHWAVFSLCLLVLFLISILQEKGLEIRKTLAHKSTVLRWAVYLLLFYSVIALQLNGGSSGGFLYEHF